MSQGFHCHFSCDVSQHLCNPSAASEPLASGGGDFPSTDPGEANSTLSPWDPCSGMCSTLRNAPPPEGDCLLRLNSLSCIYSNIIYPGDKPDLTWSCTRSKASSQLFPNSFPWPGPPLQCGITPFPALLISACEICEAGTFLLYPARKCHNRGP